MTQDLGPDDELRRRRSSDPGFLSAIRRVAAPFLAGRMRGIT